jgi:hypothetical protein
MSLSPVSVGAGACSACGPTSSADRTQTINPIKVSANPKYASGSYGNKDYGPDCGCLEAMAYAAGGAVACDEPEKACHPVQGITIPIGSNFVTVQGLADYCNMNFHCSSRIAAVSSSAQIPGPVYS